MTSMFQNIRTISFWGSDLEWEHGRSPSIFGLQENRHQEVSYQGLGIIVVVKP